MNLEQYSESIKRHAIYPSKIPDHVTEDFVGLMYVMLKLPGECAEMSEHIGKAMRDDNFILTDERKAKIRKEVGDVFWYLIRACTHLGFDPNEILVENVSKLDSRLVRGTIGGSGDDR